MPPAAGARVSAGFAGRVRAGTAAPDLTQGLMPSANVAAAVTAQAVVAEMMSWRPNVRAEKGRLKGFENPGDARGVVWERTLQGGIGSASVEVQGWTNEDSAAGLASPTRFAVGAYLVCDFLFNKSSEFGFHNVACHVESITPGCEYSQEPNTFTATLIVDGAWPDPSFT